MAMNRVFTMCCLVSVRAIVLLIGTAQALYNVSNVRIYHQLGIAKSLYPLRLQAFLLEVIRTAWRENSKESPVRESLLLLHGLGDSG